MKNNFLISALLAALVFMGNTTIAQTNSIQFINNNPTCAVRIVLVAEDNLNNSIACQLKSNYFIVPCSSSVQFNITTDVVTQGIGWTSPPNPGTPSSWNWGGVIWDLPLSGICLLDNSNGPHCLTTNTTCQQTTVPCGTVYSSYTAGTTDVVTFW